MSYDQWLYKAGPDAGPITEWESDRSVKFGSRSETKAVVESVVGELKWREDITGSSRAHPRTSDYKFEIVIDDSNIIVLKGCSHEQAKEIAEVLGVCAFDPQDGSVYVS